MIDPEDDMLRVAVLTGLSPTGICDDLFGFNLYCEVLRAPGRRNLQENQEIEEMGEETPDITVLLERAQSDPEAMSELFLAVQSQFKAIAWRELNKESGYHTLQATCLSNDAFLKLMDAKGIEWKNREQFFGAACNVMRQLLIDHFRRRSAEKRGGEWTEGMLAPAPRIVWNDELDLPSDGPLDDPGQCVAFHELLERLAEEHPDAFLVLKLHLYMGCQLKEIADDVLGIGYSTVKLRWQLARSYLRKAWTNQEGRDV